MLMRTDPFQELDKLTDRLFGRLTGTRSQPVAMPLDAYREKDQFVVAIDLPGVPPESIDLDVDRNVLTVRAERRPPAGTPEDKVDVHVNERPTGVFSRRLYLGDTLDTEHIDAHYDQGVLTLRIPVAQEAKPRRIAIHGARTRKQINA